MPLTTYRNSISKPLLELFLIAGWVDAVDITTITEQQLKDCVDKHACVDPTDYDLALLEREIRDIKLEAAGRNSSLESQVRRLCRKYTTTLEKCGYDQFVRKQPKIAVQHVLKRIVHPPLRNRMKLTLKLRKEEGFGKNFKDFVQELAKEARSLDRLEVQNDTFQTHQTPTRKIRRRIVTTASRSEGAAAGPEIGTEGGRMLELEHPRKRRQMIAKHA